MLWLMYAGLAAAVAVVPTPCLSRGRLRQLGLLAEPARMSSLRPLLRSLGGRPRLVAAVSGLAGALVGAAASFLVVGRPEVVGGPAAAGVLTGLVACRVVRAAAAGRRADRETLALCAALDCLADELRAGQRPTAALAAAAEAAGWPPVAGVFGSVAAAAALGGDVAAAAREQASMFEHGGAVRVGVESLAAAWAVSERAGAPLATALERLTADVRSRYHQRRLVLAQLAGPRATAALLAVLPVLGVLLAVGAGARPFDMLFGTPAGQVSLLAGVALDAIGVLWSLRILGSASAQP
jgi:tight adherence protein B